MKLPTPVERFRGPAAREAAGAALSLAIALALFTRFGLDDTLKRDEAIYAYAGQQLTHGVPVYASIFDPKTPLGAMFAGLFAALGKLVSVNDVHAMRLGYFVFACLTVLAVYLLALRLWRSPLGGLVAATVFAAFRGFAMDAIAGPNAKTPGIFFAVLSMALVASRRWFWAAFVGSLAFLVWQPLAVYAAIAVLVAPLVAPAGERRRAFGLAVAGAAIPVTVTVIYFWLVGALSKMIVAAFVFPATGIQRGPQTLTARLKHIASVVDSGYGHSGRLFWAGLVLLFVLFAVHLLRGRSDLRKALLHPLVSVVLPTLLVVIAFSATDFQGYPDLYPLLPYAALGLGGTAAVAVQLLPAPVLRQAAVAGALVCVLALTVLSWSWFSNDRTVNGKLAVQRVEACSLNRAVGPNGTLYAMGDPTSLVLTGRRNPTRFVYLNSGVADWDISHTPGGYRGWKAKVQATHADVIVVHDWYSRTAQKTTKWLMSAYDSAYIGRWHVFLAPGVRARAEQSGVALLARAGRPTRPTGGSGSGRC